MSNYRRSRVAGGSYFFTVVTHNRAPWLVNDDARVASREAISRCQAERPFKIDAWVLLPDHLHTVWTLPEGDEDYSARWSQIKRTVSVLLADNKPLAELTKSRALRRESVFWQRRFYEHTIRDETDFARCIDYCHLNPKKHGVVEQLVDWKWSTFHRYVAQGAYAHDWMG